MHDTVGDKIIGTLVVSAVYDLLSRVRYMREMKQINKYILWGIGSIAPGRIPIPCARCDVLWMFPAPKYTGWYSWWPVATETVVLSLLPITPTNMAPCVFGSSAIRSWQNR